MSRTDKDMPYWVRATWWEPYHYRCEHASFWRGRRRCDLPPWPASGAPPMRWRPRPAALRHCHWSPVWDRDTRGAPPRWFIRHQWTAGDRFRARAAAREAVAEHRAGWVPEAEPPTVQHRHAARWDWW